MIPNIIHFVYVGGRPFSFIHFLAVYTAWKVNCPERILFHHSEVPSGPWWERARPLLELRQVPTVRTVFGRAVHFPAHQADVIRLAALREHGGIYLDLDVICLRPLAPLRQHACVMGMEAGTGLCNAVIMAAPQAPFLQQWWEHYRDFDGGKWNEHSVCRPWQLAQACPEQIRVLNQYAFFYPAHNDLAHHYLWGRRPPLGKAALRLAKNLVQLARGKLGRGHDAARLAYYRCFHLLRGARWHYERARQSYCLHLWEGLWGESFLSAVTPAYLRQADTHFARLLRSVVDPADLASWGEQPASAPRAQAQARTASASIFSMR